MRYSVLVFPALFFMIGGCTDSKPGWSPSTAKLLFISSKNGNAEIYVTTGTDTQWINLTNNSAGDNWGRWSPDGKKIVFQSRRNGNLDIWVMNADGSEQIQLTDHSAYDYLPGWTPDGAQITFTSWRTESDQEDPALHIYIMNSDGTDEQRLSQESLNTSSGASWHPGGNSFLVSRKTGEKGADIYVASRSGEFKEQLTADTVYNGSAEYSPDGSRIAYYADNGQSSDIFVMNADGSGKTKLTDGGQNWYPYWSPDGKWIVCTVAVPGTDSKDLDIYAISVEEPVKKIKLAGGNSREQEGVWEFR